jgi:co-chaperonin GroES (HSP10)
MVATTKELASNVKISPRGSWVHIEPVEADSSLGGILLPDGSKEESQLFRVLATSTDTITSMSGEPKEHLPLEVGDLILVPGCECYAVRGVEVFLVQEHAVIATVKGVS